MAQYWQNCISLLDSADFLDVNAPRKYFYNNWYLTAWICWMTIQTA
jgi:hypothetical protein